MVTRRAKNAPKDTESTENTEAPAQSAPPVSLSVRRSEGVKRAEREKESNPFTEYVQASLDQGCALAVDAADEETAKRYTSLLRRAAQDLNVGLSQSTTPNGDGTFSVDFEAKGRKRARKYTNADIRAWYAEAYRTDAGPAELSGPISKSIRELFKEANGYGKSTVEENNSQG